jgi:hypothetical protein
MITRPCCRLLQAAIGGALGMSVAMLLETTLLIIRSNRPEPLEDRMPHLTDPHRFEAHPVAAKHVAGGVEGVAAGGAAGGRQRSSSSSSSKKRD